MDIVLKPSTLPKFNAAVTKLKADAQTSQRSQQTSVAVTALTNKISDNLSQISQYTKVLENPPLLTADTTNLTRVSGLLDAQTRQIPILDAANKCAEVKTQEDLALSQFQAIQVAVDKVSNGLGSLGTAYDSVNDNLTNLDSSVSSLQPLAPALAKKTTTDNAQLVARAKVAVTKNKPQVVAARAAVDLAASRLQAFNAAAENARCQFP